MYAIYAQYAHQLDQERQGSATRRRLIDRTVRARRWQQAAAWTARRAAIAERASRDTRPVPSWTH